MSYQSRPYRRNALATLLVLFFCLFPCACAPAAPLSVERVIVYKSQRRMDLIAHGAVIRTYRVALGFDPEGDKLEEGDGRTPEGVYAVAKKKPDSAYHRALLIDYPRAAHIFEADAEEVSPGGQIAIHGLPNGKSAQEVGHPHKDWTFGCIAVDNSEIEDIWSLVSEGTKVDIRP